MCWLTTTLSFPFHYAKTMASAYPTPSPPWAEVDPTPRRHGEDQGCGAPPSPLKSLDRDITTSEQRYLA